MAHQPGAGPEEATRERLDRLLEATLAEAEFTGAYAGPWWPVGAEDPPRAWKRAMLRRNPGGGAIHWGHLYLLIGPGSAAARVEVERRTFDRRPPPREVFRRSLVHAAVEAVVIAVASSDASVEELGAFVRKLWDRWNDPAIAG